MKNICNSFLSALVVATISIACHKDEQIKKPCDSDKGTVLTDQTGRIYRWTRSEPNFFYIGNVQPVTTGVNGGYICCNGLPDEFQSEGLIVIYSGKDKGPSPDSSDPLFAFINLSQIKKFE